MLPPKEEHYNRKIKRQRRKHKRKCFKKLFGFTKVLGKIKKNVLKGKPKTFGDSTKLH